MTPVLHLSDTHQFYSHCRTILGKQTLMDLYGYRNARLIDGWCMDPDFCETAARNPLDRIVKLFKRLVEFGRRDVAAGALRLMASAIGMEVHEPGHPQSFKSIAEECLDDLPALASFHAALMDHASTLHAINAAKAALITEIEENVSAWIKERGRPSWV